MYSVFLQSVGMSGCVESLSNITAGLAKKDRFIEVNVSRLYCKLCSHINENQAAKELSVLIQANYATEDDVVREKCYAACKRAASLLKSRFERFTLAGPPSSTVTFGVSRSEVHIRFMIQLRLNDYTMPIKFHLMVHSLVPDTQPSASGGRAGALTREHTRPPQGAPAPHTQTAVAKG